MNDILSFSSTVCETNEELNDGEGQRNAIGNDVIAEKWLETHGPGDRTVLTQGLMRDPTYLVVEKDRTLATYVINAVCTHLGWDVPWNAAENKFISHCHGSQYNDQEKIVRDKCFTFSVLYFEISSSNKNKKSFS
ncbi:Cytochrome b6-f complex iron-sulfur subunit, chloroplastic [Glycine soja]